MAQAIFNPLGCFHLAQQLVTANDEASHRTAIGRVYYSCHVIARDQLYGIDGLRLTSAARKRLTNNSNSDHMAIIISVGRNTYLRPGRAKRLSDQLNELRDMRIQADYVRDPSQRGTVTVFQKYNVSDWQGLAPAAMTLASNLLPELQQLRP